MPRTYIGNLTTSVSKPEGLKDRALIDLRASFEGRGHRPSASMWDALASLVATLERMANGECRPVFYLSSLDPGVGKTQAVIAFLRALRGHPDYSDVGVLIGVGRWDEVLAYAAEADLPDHSYAILTSNEALNSHGSGEPRSAQILFTTQQMIERRTKGKALAETEVFRFKGKPRAVKVWDETLVPAQPLTLRRDDLLRLATLYRSYHSGFAEDLEAFALLLGETSDGEVVEVPDLGSDHKLDEGSGISLISDTATEDEIKAARSYWALSGTNAVIRHDGVHKGTLASYQDHLPSDLPPIVILDASGRVRITYRWWSSRGGSLAFLKRAVKSYRNLTIHVWQRGGGKTAFKDQKISRDLVEGVATTINTKPTQDWLIVCHKLPNRNLKREISEMTSVDPSKLHFITWGSHQAINDYVDVSNIILAGTLFYPASQYEALGRAAANYSALEGEFTERRERVIREAEQRHLVLQALCRGSVRKSQGDVCAPCEAYIIASAQSGLPRTLKKVFPDCKVMPWQPIEKPLKGKVKEAAEYILGELEADPRRLIPFVEVSKHVGMSSQNFRRSVRRHEAFREIMVENDVIECAAEDGKQVRYFGRGFFYWFGDEDIPEDGFDINEYMNKNPDPSASEDGS